MDMKIYVSTHPRTKKQINKLNKINFDQKLNFINHLVFDYINLQRNAYCTISDSGTITEESSILNFPALTIRNSHERPEGMDAGVLIMSGLNKEYVHAAVEQTVISKKNNNNKNEIIDYGNNKVSEQVSKIIFSYIEYINRNTWKK